MEIAKINIIGTSVVVSDLKTVTSGMVGATVGITYDDTWDGLNKQVVFKTAFKTVNADGTAVPPELLQISGSVLRVGVYGYTEDGTIVIPTVYANLGRIMPGADPEGDEAAKPTNPIWMDAVNTAKNADRKSQEALEAAVSAERKADALVPRVELLEANISQPDWNVNDKTDPAYIKNRPFYAGDPVLTELLPETTVQFEVEGELHIAQIAGAPEILLEKLSQNDQTYIVIWDGTEYEVTASPFNGIPFLGNLSIELPELENTREPFLFIHFGQWIVETNDVSTEHTFSISHANRTIQKLPSKFLADDVGNKLPFFDLKEMGMTDVKSMNEIKLLDADTTQLRIAMGNGQIKIAFGVDGAVIKTVLSCGIISGNATYASALILNPQKINGLDLSPVIVALIAMEVGLYFILKEIGAKSTSTTQE